MNCIFALKTSFEFDFFVRIQLGFRFLGYSHNASNEHFQQMKIYNTQNDLKDTQLKSYAKIPCET